LDGHWQIFRAYYAAFRDLTSPAGEPTKATYVFTTMLLKLIADCRPDYLAVALDSPRADLERTQAYPEYKAQRAEAPEDLPVQVERIVQIVKAMGVPILQKSGAEADDIMATLARRLAGCDVRLVLVSRDKDLDQLIRPDVELYDPVKDERIDPDRLVELKGYRPEQAVEIQTLTGDSTDNVPGIPGVGPKTAVKLIGKYGSAEAVVAHADELTPKLRRNVLDNAGTIPLTRQLVTLRDDVEVDLDLDALAFRGVDAGSVRPIFEELGFRRLVDQLDAASGVAAAPPAAKAVPSGRTTAKDFEYECVDTPEGLAALVEELSDVRRLAVDTETTSVQPVWAELVGVSLSWKPGHGVYLPIAAPLGARTLDRDLLRQKLGPVLADESVEKVGQNLKYDAIVLSRASMPLAGPLFDTMLAAYVLNADRGTYKLDSLAVEYLNHECIPIEHVIGKGRAQRKMNEVPVEEVYVYAAEDADVSFRLAEVLRGRLETEELDGLFGRIEMSLLPVLADMELEGIRVDPAVLNRQKVALADRADDLREQIVAAAGCSFNPDSPKQLAEVLFEKLSLPVIRRGKTGPSTDVSVLTELAAATDCAVPALVLDYRQVTKLLNTYLEGLGQCIHPATGRVHTSFNQTGTATGRLSSSDPNLQNIPVRTEMGRQIRAAFVAGEGNVLLSADYSQVELRILAHFCGDETLLAAFEADQDIHRIVAAEVFGVSPADVTDDQRARAKTVNFGIIYGQTAYGLATTLRISRGEAGEFIKSYKARFPKIDHFLAGDQLRGAGVCRRSDQGRHDQPASPPGRREPTGQDAAADTR
jgi:DNA polymerase-1